MLFKDFSETAKNNAAKAVRKVTTNVPKRFSVRFEASANGKASNMIEEFKRHVSRAFLAVHDQNCFACNAKLEIVLHTYDTLFDFSNFGATQRALRTTLEAMGMKHPGITVSHVKAKTGSFVEVEGTFKDVSPLELYRTEAQLHDE